MSDNEFHLGKGLADNIYFGKTRRNKSGAVLWSGQKHDVTSDFYNVMIQILDEHDGKVTIEDDDCEYVFTLERRER